MNKKKGGVASAPSSLIPPPSSLSEDLRIVLWDIDGTLVRTRRQGVFKDYTTPVLVRVFGTAGRLGDLSPAGMNHPHNASEGPRGWGLPQEQNPARPPGP